MNKKLIRKISIIMLIMFSIILLKVKVKAGIETAQPNLNMGNTWYDVDRIACIAYNYNHASSYSIWKTITIDGYNSLTGNYSKNNAIMAYILNRNINGQSSAQNYSQKQLAIYHFVGTWLETNGIDLGIKIYINGHHYNQAWIDWATEEANKISNPNVSISKNPTSEISTTEITHNGNRYIRVGPYNVKFTGNISNIEVKDQNKTNIASKLIYGVYTGGTLNTGTYANIANIIRNKTDFYILIPTNGSVNIERIDSVKITVSDKKNSIKAKIWILKPAEEFAYTQTAISYATETTTEDVNKSIEYGPVELIGPLYISKVNMNDRDIKLKDVQFKFKNNNSGKYVKSENGKISYVSESQATIFKTNIKGEIRIEKLLVGKYTAYEISNPNYGYELITGGTTVDVKVKQTTPISIENKQQYVKISGYVWEDIALTNKGTTRNDLYENVTVDTADTEDKKMNGVIVRLKKKTSSGAVTVSQMLSGDKYTNPDDNTDFGQEKGKYLFYKIPIKEIDNYYVEFEYDGLIYENCEAKFTRFSDQKENEKNEQLIEDGVYKICSAINTDYLLDIASWSYANGNEDNVTGRVHLYKDRDIVDTFSGKTKENEKFLIQYQGNGYYSIYSIMSGKAIEIYGNNTSNGRRITQMGANGSNAQLWKIERTSDGKYVFRSKLNNNKCIDIADGKMEDRVNVQIYDYNGSTAQKFVLKKQDGEPIKEGSYKIKFAGDTSYLLDVKGWSKDSGGILHLYKDRDIVDTFPEKSKENQKFTIIHKGNGWYKIISNYSNLAVDITGLAEDDARQVVQYTPNNSNGQIWRIIPIGNNKYKILSGIDGNSMDVDGGKAENGTKIQIYPENYTIAQQFVFEKIDNNGLTEAEQEERDKIIEKEKNASKAIEKTEDRKNMNTAFNSVEGTNDRNKGITHGGSSNGGYNLTYNLSDYKATLANDVTPNDTMYDITASTNESGLVLGDYFKWGKEEITDINLGVYKREEPDLATANDVLAAKVNINNKSYTYKYGDRFKTQEEINKSFGDDMTVKFKNERGKMVYTNGLYASDIDYTGENKLQMSVIYKIRVVNEATTLSTRLEELTDYYDKRYTISKVGLKINEKCEITDLIDKGRIKEQSYNKNGYKKAIIDLSQIKNSYLEANKFLDIYIEFNLDMEAMKTTLKNANDEITLGNVAEVNKYTVYNKKGELYAGIDKDSAPGNATPGELNTYEDDTDPAPAFKVKRKGNRSISGTVFMDSEGTSREIRQGKLREGNGILSDTESGVKGVEVTLIETSGSGKQYKVNSGNKGKYTISGFIPGEYILQFKWGEFTKYVDPLTGEKINVQDYKSTIYNKNNYKNDKFWYLNETDRYSDAVDDYDTRKKIDEEIKNKEISQDGKIYDLTTYTKNEMTSSTAQMTINVEKGKETITNKIGNNVYKINNIDFGIIERPRQKMDIEKHISHITLTLANGQVLINSDVTYNNNGEPQIAGNYIVATNGISGGTPQIKIELDNEIIQGSTLAVEYKITVTNKSELDYANEEFYIGGEKYSGKHTTPVTITVSEGGIYDYLDKNFGGQNGTEWTEITTNEYSYAKESNPKITLEESTWIEEDENGNMCYYNYYKKTSTGYFKEKIENWSKAVKSGKKEQLSARRILKGNNALIKKYNPGDSQSIKLNASKLLSVTDEISLDNSTEIVTVDKTKGSRRFDQSSQWEYEAEQVIITPPTGDSTNYNQVWWTILAVACLGILTSGIILIKKYVLIQ